MANYRKDTWHDMAWQPINLKLNNGLKGRALNKNEFNKLSCFAISIVDRTRNQVEILISCKIKN